jgi:amidase
MAITGQTHGAYYPSQDPCGSSSGSGVASSVGLALGALGTETDGSILCPSMVNNIVGIKPTVGLTSRDLVVPISSHQDTVGPMARTVKDAAYILAAIAGKSPYDNYTDAIPFATIPDYVAACNLSALRGKRLGVPRNIIDTPQDTNAAAIILAFNAALGILHEAGAVIVEETNFTGHDSFNHSSLRSVVLQADFVSDLPNYLAQLSENPNDLRTVEDVRTFIRSTTMEEWPRRDTGLWDAGLALGHDNTAPEFWCNYTRNTYYGGHLGVTGALRNHSLDALVVPTMHASKYPAVSTCRPREFWPAAVPVGTIRKSRLITNSLLEAQSYLSRLVHCLLNRLL